MSEPQDSIRPTPGVKYRIWQKNNHQYLIPVEKIQRLRLLLPTSDPKQDAFLNLHAIKIELLPSENPSDERGEDRENSTGAEADQGNRGLPSPIQGILYQAVEHGGRLFFAPIEEEPSTDIRTRFKGATDVVTGLASLAVLVLALTVGTGEFGCVTTYFENNKNVEECKGVTTVKLPM
ncbi:uncharacterized protein K489DRAFT_385320 [Dissoconium aciculare CBS 342.82]|uniref:Uncharacterized protein n=1 Tax=Dissoconium aciculare CBS 342.82 TaxID=1314786 RepID=A0A6J3LTV3_9PEZI|nr:uncharacterized protein K489DRAFT_385320 [Dissoconium aciculare CBS 342.82]KAF1818052.1 hypothetical protein K489DRAFT_385320 [Dissoconium aciculare CBS 342.82]